MKKALVLICALALLWSCDDEKNPVQYFEVTLDPTYLVTTDLWVILHNREGEVIEVKEIETGSTISFESLTPPEKFSVTLLHYTSTDDFRLLTYHGESKNTSWTLAGGAPLSNSGTSMGSLTVRVSDPQLGEPHVGQVSPGAGFQLFASESNIDYLYTVNDVRSNRKYFISVVDKNGTPYYKFLETPITGQVNYTLADLSTFDNIASVNFESTFNYFAFVIGYEANQRPDINANTGYLTNVRYAQSMVNTSSLKLGLLNRFSNHLVFATATPVQGVTYNYEAFGPTHPGVINLPVNITTSVSETDIDGFELSSDDYDWYSAAFVSVVPFPGGGEYYRSWVIRGSDTSFKNLITMPEEILERYPEIDLSVFSFNSVNIYKGGRTYEQLLNAQFKGGHMEPYVDRYRVHF